ncbi:hypothetical protein KKP91_01490 [Methanothermococcus sp. SCGC AD-155-M21]|nr:hypothetical protein [Methanothermococcus sp. SCGC AD-155-M21]
MALDLNDEDLYRYTIIDLKELETKKVKCTCGKVFHYVGHKIICPKCKRIFSP